MTAQSVHQVNVVLAFVGIISWTTLLLLLEHVADRRVRWVRLLSFGPLHQAYDNLPDVGGVLHAVFLLAALLWLGAVFARSSKVRIGLFVAHTMCLSFLATVWALSPGSDATEANRASLEPQPGWAVLGMAKTRTNSANCARPPCIAGHE